MQARDGVKNSNCEFSEAYSKNDAQINTQSFGES